MRLKRGIGPLSWLGISLLAGCATISGPEAMRQPLLVAKVSQVQAEGAAQPARLQLNLQGKTVTETDLPGFLVQNFKGKDEWASSLNKRVRDWYEKPRDPECKRTPELLISDVKLTETGVSILGKEAPGSIQPDFAGKSIGLTLKGTFKDNKKDLELKDFRFTLEASLAQQTFIGKEPKNRVLLDDSVLLNPVSVTGSEIKVSLNTAHLPDLYLKGLHKINVESGNWYSDALIQVGDPVPPAESLLPEIQTAEVIRDNKRKPKYIHLSGKGFMVFPKFSYATLDGQFGFGFQTEVTKEGAFETDIDIPDPETFDRKSSHTIIYATPYGVTFKEFR